MEAQIMDLVARGFTPTEIEQILFVPASWVREVMAVEQYTEEPEYTGADDFLDTYDAEPWALEDVGFTTTE